MNKAFVVVLLVAASRVASAGLFYSESLGDKEASTIHKIAVCSAVGNALHLDKLGFTVFGNASHEISVPEWEVDNHLLAHALEVLKADQRFSFEQLVLPPGTQLIHFYGPETGLSPGGRQLLIERGRAQGVDAVLLIEASGSENTPLLGPGFGLYQWGRHGGDHVSVGTLIAVVLFRVEGNKALAIQSPKPLTQVPLAWPTNTPWENLESPDKKRIQDAIMETLYMRVEESLRSMKFTVGARN